MAESARRVFAALAAFGAPLADLTNSDLQVDGTVFQIGLVPNRIDVVTSIDAVTFDEGWSGRVASRYDGVPIQLLGVPQLHANKRAVGRPQDLLDVEKLEALGPDGAGPDE